MRAVIAGLGLIWAGAAAAQSTPPSLPAIAEKTAREVVAWLTGTFSNAEQAAFQSAITKTDFPEITLLGEAADGGVTIRLEGGNTADIGASLTVESAGTDVWLTQASTRCAKIVRRSLTSAAVEWQLPLPKGCEGPLALRLTQIEADALSLRWQDTALELRRANNYTCWMAAPKTAKKPDGSTDWAYFADLKLHDQGGRVWVETEEDAPQRYGYRLRQVVWPYGNSKPALTLYVYTGESPDRAVSYAWADPKAELIGINLRTMQGSCARD